jgi:hypothetical protein
MRVSLPAFDQETPSVLLTLALPRIHDQMASALVRKIHAAEGARLRVGSPLLDVDVDLSSVAEHDCPPISCYRIAPRESAWLRRLEVAAQADIVPGTPIALLSTEADEALDGPRRALRVSVAAIMPQSHWLEDA